MNTSFLQSSEQTAWTSFKAEQQGCPAAVLVLSHQQQKANIPQKPASTDQRRGLTSCSAAKFVRSAPAVTQHAGR